MPALKVARVGIANRRSEEALARLQVRLRFHFTTAFVEASLGEGMSEINAIAAASAEAVRRLSEELKVNEG